MVNIQNNSAIKMVEFNRVKNSLRKIISNMFVDPEKTKALANINTAKIDTLPGLQSMERNLKTAYKITGGKSRTYRSKSYKRRTRRNKSHKRR